MKRKLGFMFLLLILPMFIFTQQDTTYANTVTLEGGELVDNRTLVPLRSIFEELGATVQWEQATQTITATQGQRVIKLTVGSRHTNVNGQNVVIDVPAQVKNGRTLVPLRFVSEAMGASVKWDGEQNAATITTPNKHIVVNVGGRSGNQQQSNGNTNTNKQGNDELSIDEVTGVNISESDTLFFNSGAIAVSHDDRITVNGKDITQDIKYISYHNSKTPFVLTQTFIKKYNLLKWPQTFNITNSNHLSINYMLTEQEPIYTLVLLLDVEKNIIGYKKAETLINKKVITLTQDVQEIDNGVVYEKNNFDRYTIELNDNLQLNEAVYYSSFGVEIGEIVDTSYHQTLIGSGQGSHMTKVTTHFNKYNQEISLTFSRHNIEKINRVITYFIDKDLQIIGYYIGELPE